MALGGEAGALRHTARQSWLLWFALTQVLQMGRATSDVLRVLSEHVCHHTGLFPPALAALDEIFL